MTVSTKNASSASPVFTLTARLDHALTQWAFRRAASDAGAAARHASLRFIDTDAGRIRVVDSSTPGPVIIFVPDGPNVVEHYQVLMDSLCARYRVVCFDMPGFGFSLPANSYAHSLDQGAKTVLQVLDALQIPSTTLAFSCANGFYALRVASLAPDRVAGLVLSQTPSLQAMHAWTDRVVPRPLRRPLLGQALGWLARRKAAAGWYRIALPVTTDGAPFHRVAQRALQCGACFSLAGVVQGLLSASDAGLKNQHTPCTVIWGAQDRSHRYTQPNSLLSLVPHADFVQFDDCGHFPDLEQPQRYAQLLTQAIETHGP